MPQVCLDSPPIPRHPSWFPSLERWRLGYDGMRLDLVRLGLGVRGGSLTRLVPALVPCLSVTALNTHQDPSPPIPIHIPSSLDLRPVHPFVFHFPSRVYRGFVVHKSRKGKRQHHPIQITYLLSKFPAPSLQNPNAQIPMTAPKIAIPPGPRVGKLRLYLIVSYPPAGGISLLISFSSYFLSHSMGEEYLLSESMRHLGCLCLFSVMNISWDNTPNEDRDLGHQNQFYVPPL